MANKVVVGKKTKKLVKLNNDIQATVFIIMPYGDYFDTYYEDIYKKSIKKIPLNPFRLDESNLPTAIVQEMYANTKKAEIVLVDLSGDNPNVFYELGLSHALDKPTIIIKDSSEAIPFDVSAFRVLRYDKNRPDWGKILKEKLIESLTEVHANPTRFLPSKLLKTPDNENSEALESIQGQVIELERKHLINELSHLKDERRRLLHNDVRHKIGPEEARAILDSYYKKGASTAYIVNKLISLGAPRSWVLDQLDKKKKR